MIPSYPLYLQSFSEIRDQVLELIDNCVLGPDDSVLVLQSVLSPQSLIILELEYEEEHLNSINNLNISKLLDEDAATFE